VRGSLAFVLAVVTLRSAVPLAAQDLSPPAALQDAAPAAPVEHKPIGWDDKRRTMRSYGSNLLYNFAGVVTTGNHMPLLVTTAFSIPAYAWDEDAVAYFQRHPHEQWGKIGAALGGTVAVTGLTIGFFSIGRRVSSSRIRASTYDLSQAIIVNQVYTQALKFIVQRERPDHSNQLSFPSGHASNAFTAAAVIARHYPHLAIPGFGVASYIALSRMAANKHHFSDVVAGAGFGFGVGRAVVRRNSRPPDQPGTKDVNVRLLPDPGPSGEGTGFSLHVAF
jgi:membrane-associated phospholipid phosphatase